MSTVRSTNPSPAAAGNKHPMHADCSLGFDALKIRIIQGDIGNSASQDVSADGVGQQVLHNRCTRRTFVGNGGRLIT
jgi:hypothetical protein